MSGGQEPEVNPEGHSGNGYGLCGGDDATSRANAANVESVVVGPWYKSPDSHSWLHVALYSFKSPTSAQQFMDLTSDAVLGCPKQMNYEAEEIVEGEEPSGEMPTLDFFAGELNPDANWEMKESTSLGSTGDVVSDSSFFMNQMTTFSISVPVAREQYGFSAGNYGLSKHTLAQYERHNQIVIVYRLSTQCCLFGWSASQRAVGMESLPTHGDLVPLAGHFQKEILEALSP
jgi:hypothetical protein